MLGRWVWVQWSVGAPEPSGRHRVFAPAPWVTCPPSAWQGLPCLPFYHCLAMTFRKLVKHLALLVRINSTDKTQQRNHVGTGTKAVFSKWVSHSAPTPLPQGRQDLSCSGAAPLSDPGMHPACNQLQWPRATGICGMSKWKSGCDLTYSQTPLCSPSLVWETGKQARHTLLRKASSKHCRKLNKGNIQGKIHHLIDLQQFFFLPRSRQGTIHLWSVFFNCTYRDF